MSATSNKRFGEALRQLMKARGLSYRSLAAAPDGRTLYYGAQQVEANIWKVEQPKVKK